MHRLMVKAFFVHEYRKVRFINEASFHQGLCVGRVKVLQAAMCCPCNCRRTRQRFLLLRQMDFSRPGALFKQGKAHLKYMFNMR